MLRLKEAALQQVAQLVAEGRATDEKIAEQFGIERTTLWRLKKRPAFAALVSEETTKYAEAARKIPIARQECRLARIQDTDDRLAAIVEARAHDPELAKVPGGSTGLICKTLKGIGKGDDFQVVEVCEPDTPLVKARIGLWELAAKETGQIEESRLKAQIGLAEAIAEARKRAAQVARYAIPQPSATFSKKETQTVN